MPVFRFAAMDSTGESKRGTVEAPTESMALAKVRMRGLKVVQITPVDTESVSRPADTPWYKGPDDAPGAPLDPDRATNQPNPPRTGGRPLLLKVAWLPLAFSGLALILASAALIIVIAGNPLGKGIGGYDFSTPEAAAKSMVQIGANRDIRAKLDVDDLQHGGNAQDAVRTLEINRVVDFSDKKVLFVSYLQKGTKRKKVLCFEKDLESKLWIPKFLSPLEVMKTNEQLAKEMEAWTDKDSD